MSVYQNTLWSCVYVLNMMAKVLLVIKLDKMRPLCCHKIAYCNLFAKQISRIKTKQNISFNWIFRYPITDREMFSEMVGLCVIGKRSN